MLESNPVFAPLANEKVVSLLRSESEKWIQRLTDEEIRAIKKYTKNSGDPRDDKFYLKLNAMLRGAREENTTLRYYAELISSGLRKFSVQYDLLCYRSMNLNPYTGVNVGEIILPMQFLSTSVTRKGALNGQFKMLIRVPAGSTGAYIEMLSRYPNQREFLLDKDCAYKVIDVRQDAILLEVIT